MTSTSPYSTNGAQLRPLHIVLFILAALLIGRASITQTYSSLSFPQYEHGLADMPYQSRYLMVPVLRWAAASPLLQRAATVLKHSCRGPEDLLLQIVNAACLIAMGFLAVRLRNRLSPASTLPWLAPFLLLWITVCTYVARYENSVIYPYDFLAALIFTLGVIASMEYRPALLVLAIFVGSYNRETSVFLLPLWFSCNFDRKRAKVWLTAVIGLVAWIVPRLQIRRWTHFASSGLVIPWRVNLDLLFPHHWAQVASVGGFLLLPMWVRRDLVPDNLLKRVWLGIVPFLLADLIVGWWNETRIFGELDVIFAVTAAIQFEQYLLQTNPPLIASAHREQ